MSEDWPEEPTEKRMAIVLVAPRTEPELLAAIDRQDHAARVVYADWLEEQGDFERAEYVRLQDLLVEIPPGPAQTTALNRVRQLALKIDAAWRVIVARPRILDCAREACPREWGSLAPSHTRDLRMCGTCKRPVEYLFTVWNTGRRLVVLDSWYDGEWPAS